MQQSGNLYNSGNSSNNSLTSLSQQLYPATQSTSSNSSNNGFTLLQGHIQLMAMVPHLPENQLSPPRWRDNEGSSDDTGQHSNNITPRMMPSANKFQRPHLASTMPGKAGYPSYVHSPHQQPCALSNLSLPPKPAHPIAMPSFARYLPGTKRQLGISPLEQPRQNAGATGYLPIIPQQPSFQQCQQLVESSPQRAPAIGLPYNPYNPTSTQTFQLPPQFRQQQRQQLQQQPQLGYQMVNFIDPYGYALGGGDHGMFIPVQHHPHLYCQQQMMSYQPQAAYPSHAGYPYQMTQPYAVQSMPCFGTAYQSGKIGPHGIMLPPEPSEPVYSASMPEIWKNVQKVKRKPSKLIQVGDNNEFSILVEDESSVSMSSDSEDEHHHHHHDLTVANSNTSTETGKPHQLIKDPSKTIMAPSEKSLIMPMEVDETKFAMLGPESNPTKIPSNPRVSHTPPSSHIPPLEFDLTAGRVCNEEEECICSRCNKHKPAPRKQEKGKKNLHGNNNSSSRSIVQGSKLSTPRKVVVAVRDCFPSESSGTDSECPESPHRPPPTSLIHGPRRKAKLDALLNKNRKGDSAEVFSDLSDLNPDEVRLFTCEYLGELLSSDDWSNCYLGLQTMVRMARHRPKLLLSYLGPILWFAFKHLTSPKSALCRAAIVTFKELFQRIGSALDNDLEKLTEKLVVKSLAPNQFIREECDRALVAMVHHCSLVKVLQAMDTVSKKQQARAACQRIARMTEQFVKVAGVDTCLKPTYAEKLLPMLFSFMTEANNETRSAAKQALGMLMNHLQFEKAVTKHVTFDRNSNDVFKKLDKMRGRCKIRGPRNTRPPPARSTKKQ